MKRNSKVRTRCGLPFSFRLLRRERRVAYGQGLFVVVTAYSSINHDKRPIYPSTAHFHHKWREETHLASAKSKV